ncbi:ABC transporter ATP-binding protein [Actibacterium sp. D379-3]
MTAITLEGIAKSFGDTAVLGGVDLAIRPGEFLTLVGPSGCGKSTLLRILAGLEAPDAGRVMIGGQDVTAIRPAARNLAMVFQSYALYPHLTVAENMMTPLRLRDLGRAQQLPVLGPLLSRAKRRDIRDQVVRTAEVLKIDHLLARKPGQLSGGQRQRVALGRAMVRQPVAFLMDEPLSNLDAALRVHMRAELSQLHRDLGTTFIYVTHDQAEALTMSDRVAVMMGGRVLQLGSPDAIYADPDTLEVAAFIGSPRINLLPAECDGAGRVSVGDYVLPVSSDAGRGPITAGLRPEHIHVAPAGAPGLRGHVVHRENLGSDIFVHVGIDGLGQPLVVRLHPGDAPAIGQAICLAAKPDSPVLLFDAAGHRLRRPARQSVVEVA